MTSFKNASILLFAAREGVGFRRGRTELGVHGHVEVTLRIRLEGQLGSSRIRTGKSHYEQIWQTSKSYFILPPPCCAAHI